MSKFKIVEGAKLNSLYRYDDFLCFIAKDDLADLASCASAALAEQNSRVMSEAVCKCDLPEVKKYNVQPLRSPCAYFEPHAHQLLPLDDERVCVHCEHRRKCHATQNTENQGE